MAVSTDRIVLAPQPRGVFRDVVVIGTPKPGQCMVPVPGQTALDDSGTLQYEPAGTTAAGTGLVDAMTADGDNIPIAVLIEDALQGVVVSTAYTTGKRGRVYFPVAGEELNVMFQNQSGTADDLGIGTKLIVDDGTGKVLKSTGTPQSEPFQSMQVLTDPTADQLIHVMFTGN